MSAAPLDRRPVGQPSDGGRALEGYRTRRYAHQELRGPDEFLDPDGEIRPGWEALAAGVELLGPEGLTSRIGQVRRLLQDDGVTYATGGVDAVEAQAGSWRLDPLPTIVTEPDWDVLALGLQQRAELLDLVLRDVYGPRKLIDDGVLPPEVVFGHAGFLRQCDGIKLPGPHQLLLTATDLVRRPDGWYALGDRAQAPSGSGYAMQNRRVVSKVMPGLYRDTYLRRLRSFFHAVRSALQGVAPRRGGQSGQGGQGGRPGRGEMPRVVILTPGAPSETSFEHAFLSTLLGFPLVEGRDLQVRDEQVWFRSLGRPERVDVVLRRVDDWFCDPLELRGDSTLGVPGLLNAARAGNVSIVNPPGSGVLENGGLVPYLPVLARHLLGEPLRLNSVPTWWCGEQASRRYVLEHLDDLVVRPIARGVGRANRFGWELSRAERAELRARIEAEPHLWSAQERLEMSSTPVATPSGLEPRRMVLRAFAVATADGYELMNGGLGRVGADVASLDVSNQSGATAKDVWVVTDQPVDGLAVLPGAVPPDRVMYDAPVPVPAGELAAAVPARVAEDLFWLGRYAERAEDAARLLRVAADLAADHAAAPGSVGHRSMTVMLRALTGVTTTFPGFIGAGAAERVAQPHPELLRLAVDPFLPGSLGHALRHTIEAAYGVRELLSTDTFQVFSGMERALLDLSTQTDPQLHLQPAASRVLEGLLALSGLAAESMVRDGGWFVMDAGRRIERSLQLVQLLRYAVAEPLAVSGVPGGRSPEVEELVLESVLIAAESVITMRRRVPGRPRLDAVLELLLLDRSNPRGLWHQLTRLTSDLEWLETGLPRTGPLPELESVRRILADGLPDPAAPGSRAELLNILETLVVRLSALAHAVARTYFARVLPPRPMAAGGGDPR